MQFLDNRVRILYPNFMIYMGDLLKFKKKIILVFSKVMTRLIFSAIFLILHGIININL